MVPACYHLGADGGVPAGNYSSRLYADTAVSKVPKEAEPLASGGLDQCCGCGSMEDLIGDCNKNEKLFLSVSASTKGLMLNQFLAISEEADLLQQEASTAGSRPVGIESHFEERAVNAALRR